MHKLLQYKTLTLFLVFIIVFVVSFKPLLIKAIEWYVGDLLKTELHISSLDLYPTKVDAYIKNTKNRVSISVKEQFPLQAEVTYDGNMNVFKEYVTLDANTSLSALVIYDKELVIDAETNLSIPAFDTLQLNSKLNMQDEKLSISLDVAFAKNSEYDFDANISKEGNITLVNLQSDIFGGDTDAVYEENKLKVKVKNIHLSKLLKQYKVDIKARGYISALAEVDTKTFKSTLSIHSPKIRYEKEILKDVVIDIKKLSYDKKRLKLDYTLSLKYAKENLLFRGDVDYKDSLVVSGSTKHFGSNTKFNYTDDRISLSAIDINIKDVLLFYKQAPYAVGKFDLNIAGKMDQLDIVVKSDKLVLDKNLTHLDDSVSLNIKAKYTPKQVTFQTKAQAKTFQLNKSVGVYDLVKKELYLKQNFKLLYEKNLIPLFVDMVYADEVLRMKSPSFGGKLELELKKNKVNIKMNRLHVDKIAKIMNKEPYVKDGIVNGKIFYDFEKKRARTDIRVNKMSLKGIDLDTALGVMGLNIFSLTDIFLKDDVDKVTKIQHLEIDLDYENDMIELSDVAFSTLKYRIAALGSIHQDGNITSLDIHVLDKNGCSGISQKLTNSIYDIKLANKLSTSVEVVSSIPSSLVSRTKNILDFTTGVVDNTATFLVHESHLSENNISLVSSISKSVSARLSKTVDIVSLKCKPVYSGLVKHPFKD